MPKRGQDIVIGLEPLEPGQRVLDFSKLEITGAGDSLLRNSLREAIDAELIAEQIDEMAGEGGEGIDVHAKGSAHVKG